MEAPLSARAALLQALTVPGYGLDLIDRVSRASGGRVRLRIGSVYPALLFLERHGLVRRRSVAARGRGRPRGYYELTVRGVQAARDEREAVLGLLRSTAAPVPGPPASPMIERLRSCSDLSTAVLELQRGMREASGRR